ncbi:MAG: hypothetical protein P9L88_08875 [Candidatus Tantalella remota]|nr:hypothetical protein [Candidatus Tantalella remota]
MANIEGLTKEEIKDLVIDELKGSAVDVGDIEIEVLDGPRIILKGTVDSIGEHYLVTETITGIVGIEDISDELIIINAPDDGSEDDRCDDGGLMNRDDEEIGTEDAFQSMEDGIPYIPPTSPSYKESSEITEWKKKKRKRKL